MSTTAPLELVRRDRPGVRASARSRLRAKRKADQGDDDNGSGEGCARHGRRQRHRARSAALALQGDGWNVVVTGRRKEELDKTVALAKAGGGKMLGVTADVGKPEDVKRLFAETKKAFGGRLDFLFNNAGFGAPPVPMEDLPFETWKSVVDVILHGSFLCAQEAIKIMKDAEPQGRAHRQQRLDLGLHAAAQLGGLHVDQACHHRTHQVHRARRPQARHRLRPARHRQRRHRHGRPHEGRRAAGQRRRSRRKPVFDVEHCGSAIRYMASLPLDTNVLFMNIKATKMPFEGRG